MDASSELQKRLVALRDEMRARLRLRGWLTALAVWLGLALLLGLLDAAVGFETGGRKVMAGLLLVTAVAGFALAWLQSRRIHTGEAAARVDALTGDRRGLARIGSDLAALRAAPGADSLEAYLTRRALHDALEKVKNLSPSALVTPGDLRRAGIALGAALGVLAGVTLWQPAPTWLVTQRLFLPERELPPYSPYQFLLDPAEPKVIYGKALAVSAEITGASLEDAEVQLLTRPAGSRGSAEVDRLPVFREAGQRYGQKLEGVTSPLEIAFAIGRARSAWLPVEILWQPQLEKSEVTITPPSYARRKVQTGALTGEVRGLRGSTVVLRLTSNRPLSGGVLEAREENSPEVVEKVSGRPLTSDMRTVEFRWDIARDCRWTVDLRDIRGTRMAEPVRFAQRVVPDEKPTIDLISPGPVAMATPSTALQLEWQVGDDLGLDRASWVRTADGFRDRVTEFPAAGGETTFQIRREIQLASLGVKPGQMLEFFVEARDRNPSLMGVSSSQPARVQIISEEDYAAQIQTRTTIEEFAARYQVLREALDAAAASLEALAEAAKTGDREKMEAARQTALNQQRRAAQWFGDFADDFPAFATDKELSELSGDLQEELEKNAADLEGDSGWTDPAKAGELAKKLRERLQPGSDRLDEQEGQAEELAKIARVAEMAAELQAIHQEQREVAEDLARFAEELALGITTNRHQVPGLRLRQLRNEERLREVEEKLPERLADLPPEAAELKEGAEKVLEGLKTFDVAKQMGDAAAKIASGNLLAASNDALLARGNLDQILGQPDNPFCEMCQGRLPGGMGTGGAMQQQALAQMMAALQRRAAGQGGQAGGGAGEGGQGFGAKGGSGSSMSGTQLPIPLIGPPRLQLNGPNRIGGSGEQSGEGPGGRGAAGVPETAGSALPGSEVHTGAGGAPSLDEVPMKYRDAVKNYFSNDAPAEPAAPPTPVKPKS
jgi:hypothetical protein